MVKLLKIIVLMFYLLVDMNKPCFVKANCSGNGKAPEDNPLRVNSIVIPYSLGGSTSTPLKWSDFFFLPNTI